MKWPTFIFLFIPVICFGQIYSKKELKNLALTSSLCFALGICDGTAEGLEYHYDAFRKIFPKAKENFWNPDMSWRNKWKNGDPGQGERFWQSRASS